MNNIRFCKIYPALVMLFSAWGGESCIHSNRSFRYKALGVITLHNQMVKLTIASAKQPSVLKQSVSRINMVCVWYRKCLKFGVTTLVQLLNRNLKQKNKRNKQYHLCSVSVCIFYTRLTLCAFAMSVILYLVFCSCVVISSNEHKLHRGTTIEYSIKLLTLTNVI